MNRRLDKEIGFLIEPENAPHSYMEEITTRTVPVKWRFYNEVIYLQEDEYFIRLNQAKFEFGILPFIAI